MSGKYDYVAETVTSVIKELEDEKEYLIKRLIAHQDCSVCQLNNSCSGSYDGCFVPIEDGELVKCEME